MSRSIAVVGAGLVGSALSRRLAEAGGEPICFGPRIGPPFSSHDDSGRLTRILDASPIWARLAARAIDEYPDVELRSGVRFHHPVGVLWSARAPGPIEELEPVRSAMNVQFEPGLGGWEGLAGLDGDETLLERGAAGYIAPKDMVRAHRILAERSGAAFEERVVKAIEPSNGRWVIRQDGAEPVTVDRVVITAGAGSRDLVDIQLDVTGEVVIDAPVVDAGGAKLDELPCIGRLSADSTVEGYLTPPIRGGDGWSVKFGAELPETVTLGSASDVSAWMAGDAHEQRLPAMASALGELLPGLGFGPMRTRPCIYTRTRSGLPIVDELERGLFVATGGNGRMAKSADAVAALAARLVLEGEWDDEELDRSLFAV